MIIYFVDSCQPFSSTDRMVKHLNELAGSLKDHEKAVFLQVFQYRIKEKMERLRSMHYEEVSQTFRNAAKAGVEFWEFSWISDRRG
ncbi:DNA/RNA nuclease SfsA [Lactimicrobium massiliense]|uniref:DNA/RNA nuclease SfsA n=1 Tax=Lactimicrobium massiliense TaxID=2161814 RepID=UPI000D5624C8